MKPQEVKTEFIKLRAEGKSFNEISKKLNISKATCSKWAKELETAVATIKQEQLNELYESYHMTKEARIKSLGGTLELIETALNKADLSKVSPEKLLDYKLKYTALLKEEYGGSISPYKLNEEMDSKVVLNALGDLLNRVRLGDVSVEQTNKECIVLNNILKAYDQIELKTKIDELEKTMESRNAG